MLVSLLSKAKSPENYRIAAMAVIGFAYFVVWRFVQYLVEIHGWGEITRSVLYIGVGVVAFGVCLTPIVLNVGKLSARVSAGIFLLTIVVMLVFESPIKNKLALATGFYAKPFVTSGLPVAKESKNRFYQHYAGYSLKVPDQWILKEDKGKEFPYFVLGSNARRLIEFRPRCHYGTGVVMPELIAQLNKEDLTTSECFMWSEKQAKICVVKTKKPKEMKTRWRYFIEPLNLSQGGLLDFYFDSMPIELQQGIVSAVESIEFDPVFSPKHACISRSDWF